MILMKFVAGSFIVYCGVLLCKWKFRLRREKFDRGRWWTDKVKSWKQFAYSLSFVAIAVQLVEESVPFGPKPTSELRSLFAFLSDTNAQNIINQALYLGSPTSFNTTRDDCKWKHGNERDICPDPDINVILYTSTDQGKNRGKLWVSV
jgi:hypothetical protein